MSYRSKRTYTLLQEAGESKRLDVSAESYSISPRGTHVTEQEGRSPNTSSNTPDNVLPSNSVNPSIEDRPYKKRISRIESGRSQEHVSSHLPCNTDQNTKASSSSTSHESSEHTLSVNMDDGAPQELQNEADKECVSRPSGSPHVKSNSADLNWSDQLDFDEKEEVLTIDAEGKHMLLSGRILPHDIDNLEVGVRCVVQFNEFNQPIRKGGSILAKYLGSMAKNKTFCPIGEKSWHLINKENKARIIQVVRSKFVIPEGKLFNRAILMRVSKKWRNYKHSMKKMKFDPDTRSKDEIFDDVPRGQTRDSWIHLVKYWYSQESQKLSQYGKKAWAAKSHVHTTGCTSYANKRADFVDSNGRQPSHIEFYEMTHTQIGGGSDDNAVQFLAEANARVEESVKNASSLKSRVEIENEVFHSLIYEDRQPKRPIGYGLGIKESDIFGAQSLLRKRSIDSTNGHGTNNSMEVQNLKATLENMKKENEAALEHAKKENQELRDRMNHTNQILLQALNAIHTGVVSSEFLDAVESTLDLIDSQVVCDKPLQVYSRKKDRSKKGAAGGD